MKDFLKILDEYDVDYTVAPHESGVIVLFLFPYAPFEQYPEGHLFVDNYYVASQAAHKKVLEITSALRDAGCTVTKYREEFLKPLAVRLGAATRCKNDLVYTEKYGSYFYINAIQISNSETIKKAGGAVFDTQQNTEIAAHKGSSPKGSDRDRGADLLCDSLSDFCGSPRSSTTTANDIPQISCAGGVLSEIGAEKISKEESKIINSQLSTLNFPKDCDLCIRACPGGALSESGFDRAKCLRQFMDKRHTPTAEEQKAVGDRLMGCIECRAVCPRNAHIKPVPIPARLFAATKKDNLDYNIIKEFIGDNLFKK